MTIFFFYYVEAYNICNILEENLEFDSPSLYETLCLAFDVDTMSTGIMKICIVQKKIRKFSSLFFLPKIITFGQTSENHCSVKRKCMKGFATCSGHEWVVTVQTLKVPPDPDLYLYSETWNQTQTHTL
ncbi:hypothetical protein M9H77_26423 [Catharanthus roseus]|uniref:Uncharacterized protein n=1 Tax=Catharanthus roseus TaxID=4058 RepID=A0ACC0AB55_CATRO|nr:hypothetical protein M9H77_26423 [Catharanthus roseus]